MPAGRAFGPAPAARREARAAAAARPVTRARRGRRRRRRGRPRFHNPAVAPVPPGGDAGPTPPTPPPTSLRGIRAHAPAPTAPCRPAAPRRTDQSWPASVRARHGPGGAGPSTATPFPPGPRALHWGTGRRSPRGGARRRRCRPRARAPHAKPKPPTCQPRARAQGAPAPKFFWRGHCPAPSHEQERAPPASARGANAAVAPARSRRAPRAFVVTPLFAFDSPVGARARAAPPPPPPRGATARPPPLPAQAANAAQARPAALRRAPPPAATCPPSRRCARPRCPAIPSRLAPLGGAHCPPPPRAGGAPRATPLWVRPRTAAVQTRSKAAQTLHAPRAQRAPGRAAHILSPARRGAARPPARLPARRGAPLCTACGKPTHPAGPRPPGPALRPRCGAAPTQHRCHVSFAAPGME
jgi:hypothetical protein